MRVSVYVSRTKKRRVGGRQTGREKNSAGAQEPVGRNMCACHQPSPGKPKPQVLSQFSLPSLRPFSRAVILQLVLTGDYVIYPGNRRTLGWAQIGQIEYL